ncbi:MAG: flagellar basal body rod protein FlgB [Spirochaetes bacterium]|jgi:flagellar basal-body rod protein FlgB|nr:flagellar basal body rod protein FlgB [Spirochaetota bacterium]
MFESSKMMLTNHLLEESLNVESLRRKVISNNISNVDVPHFKRSEVNFESQLRRTIKNNKFRARNEFPGIMTDEKHIPFNTYQDVRSVGSRVNLDYSTSMRNDGNNVDIEKEMVDAAKNLMRYNASVTALTQNFKLLKSVMRPA